MPAAAGPTDFACFCFCFCFRPVPSPALPQLPTCPPYTRVDMAGCNTPLVKPAELRGEPSTVACPIHAAIMARTDAAAASPFVLDCIVLTPATRICSAAAAALHPPIAALKPPVPSTWYYSLASTLLSTPFRHFSSRWLALALALHTLHTYHIHTPTTTTSIHSHIYAHTHILTMSQPLLSARHADHHTLALPSPKP